MVVRADAIVIVLDIGKSMHSDKCSPSALEESKKCISMIIQRKIFSESKDEIALILCGSCEASKQSTEKSDSKCMNITLVQDLRPASWKLLESVDQIQGTDISSDLIRDSALLTAIHLLQDVISGKKFLSQRILFFSNFDGYFYGEKVNMICDEMKELKVELNVIGPVAFPVEDIKCENEDEIHVSNMLQEVNGESYSFNDVLPTLSNYEMKKVQPFPWNENLNIGENLAIPISVYIKVSECKSKTWESACIHNLDVKPKRHTAYCMKDELQTEVSLSDTISAFKYGTTLVPYSEDDKKNMDYQPGGKGMKMLGFTKAENIQRYSYTGDKSRYVFGRKNNDFAGEALASFIQALHDTNRVAIVRYVSTARSAPSIGFLSPRIKLNYECLVFVPLPFMEDLRHLVFTPLDSDSKNVPTEDQLKAVDDLITAMDLTVPLEEDEEEILKPKNTVNPYLQRLYQCLQYRAIHPKKPLPSIEPHIQALINPSPKLVKRAETSFKKISSLFSLKKTEAKRLLESGSDIFSNRKSEESIKKYSLIEDSAPEVKFDVTEAKLVDAVTDKIFQVGSINPVRDIQYLINNQILPFNNICEQINDVVVKFLQDSDRLRFNYSKILSVCKEFRRASMKEGCCEKYNSFMMFVQKHLLASKEDLWDKIINENIGLISKDEIPSSTISSEQAQMFLSKPCLHEESKDSIMAVDDICDDDDFEDLLDQM